MPRECTIKKELHGDKVIYLREQPKFWFLPFWHVWKDWKSPDSDMNKCDQKLDELCKEIVKVLTLKEEFKQQKEADKKFIKESCRHMSRQITKEISFTVSDKEAKFVPLDFVPESSGFFKQVIKPELIDGKIPSNAMAKFNDIIGNRSGSTLTKFVPDLASIKPRISHNFGNDSVDDLIQVNLSNNEKGKGGKNNTKGPFRKKRSDETHEEHMERLKRIDSGNATDGDFEVID